MMLNASAMARHPQSSTKRVRAAIVTLRGAQFLYVLSFANWLFQTVFAFASLYGAGNGSDVAALPEMLLANAAGMAACVMLLLFVNGLINRLGRKYLGEAPSSLSGSGATA